MALTGADLAGARVLAFCAGNLAATTGAGLGAGDGNTATTGLDAATLDLGIGALFATAAPGEVTGRGATIVAAGLGASATTFTGFAGAAVGTAMGTDVAWATGNGVSVGRGIGVMVTKI